MISFTKYLHSCNYFNYLETQTRESLSPIFTHINTMVLIAAPRKAVTLIGAGTQGRRLAFMVSIPNRGLSFRHSVAFFVLILTWHFFSGQAQDMMFI